MENKYPQLIINAKKFKENYDIIIDKCKEFDIKVTAVVKGFHAIPELIAELEKTDCVSIASSRMEQIVSCREMGCKKPLGLLRLPMLCEIEELVKYADFSLNSEKVTLDAINKECGKQGKRHGVMLMADLGDLREGFWDKKELVDMAVYVENSLENIDLGGVGTNLGCYGSVLATTDKMHELIEIADDIEKAIGRKLNLVSGGATTSTPLVFKKTMPRGINHLRLGEGATLAHDYEAFYNCNADFLHKDVFTVKAQVIEVKDKPSHPVGEIAVDCFGKTQEYTDRGIRRRALLAMGRVDVGDEHALNPMNPGIEVIGASSDHLIVDVENCKDEVKVGDVLEFDVCYSTMVYLTSSANVNINVVK